jgi:hypothetical protein
MAEGDGTEWILERLLPSYDFRTRYARRVAAPPDGVWQALQEVTAAELPIARLLMRIRSPGRTRLSGRLMEMTPVPSLSSEDGREAVYGRVAKLWRIRPVPGPPETNDPAGFAAFSEPGWAKAALSFQLTPTADGTVLAAETRVMATDEASRRRFGRYWRLIRMGGAGFIRLELLRAIARRAEEAGAAAD